MIRRDNKEGRFAASNRFPFTSTHPPAYPRFGVESRDASRVKPRRLNGSAGIWFSYSLFCVSCFADCDHTVITVTFVCTWTIYSWLLICSTVDNLISHCLCHLFCYLSSECFTWSDPYTSSVKYDGTFFRVSLSPL